MAKRRLVILEALEKHQHKRRRIQKVRFEFLGHLWKRLKMNKISITYFFFLEVPGIKSREGPNAGEK